MKHCDSCCPYYTDRKKELIIERLIRQWVYKHIHLTPNVDTCACSNSVKISAHNMHALLKHLNCICGWKYFCFLYTTYRLLPLQNRQRYPLTGEWRRMSSDEKFLVSVKKGMQGSYRPWKVLELKCWDFQAWKVLEKGICPGKPWKSPGILK